MTRTDYYVKLNFKSSKYISTMIQSTRIRCTLKQIVLGNKFDKLVFAITPSADYNLDLFFSEIIMEYFSKIKNMILLV